MDARLEICLRSPPIPGIGTVGHLELRWLPALAAVEREQNRLHAHRTIVVRDAGHSNDARFQFGTLLWFEDVTHQANVPGWPAVLHRESESFSRLEQRQRNAIFTRMVEVRRLGRFEPQAAEPF